MRSFWNLYAFFYDSLRHLLPYQELMARAVKALNIKKDGLRILDAGCGTGNFAEFLAKSINHKVCLDAVDASSVMLKRARKKLGKYGWVKTCFSDLNLPLPYADGTFDGIVCLNTLYALKDPEKTLKEFQRVLKFGGLLVLANPKENPKVLDAIYEHYKKATRPGQYIIPLFFLPIILCNLLIKRWGQKRKYHFLNPQTLEGLFKRTGFRVLESDNVYGNTAVILTATKVLLVRDTSGVELEVTMAHTENDFSAIYGLRYKVYCEEKKYLDPKKYPKKLESDLYDNYSAHIVVRLSEEIVGTMRLIKDNPHGFLIEEAFSLPPTIDRIKTIEHSRAVVKKEYRRNGLFAIMTEIGYIWQKERGYDICVGAAAARVKIILDSLGWKPFGDTKNYHNASITPMFFCLKK